MELNEISSRNQFTNEQELKNSKVRKIKNLSTKQTDTRDNHKPKTVS